MTQEKPYSIAEYDPASVADTLQNLPALLRRLLYNRGITNADAVARFLDPDFDAHTHDPSQLKDVKAAVDRITDAIADGEKTVIYSDYDTDGIPAAVILKDVFERIGYDNFESFIPHRNTRGFGVHEEAIDTFINDGVDLLITIDCGMGAAKEVAYAKDNNIDSVIIDHHEPNGTFPDAFAIVNPKQADCGYPFDELCAAGVVFKLAQAMCQHIRQSDNIDFIAETPEGWEKWLLDMVGIATIADMVPLVDENRVLAKYGLQVLRKSRRPGLRQLLETANVNQRNMDESDIGFGIGPLINAASRMDAPEDAYEILGTRDRKRAKELADHLEIINNKRKGKVSAITKAANKKLEKRDEIGPVAVTGNPDWQPSLLGLAANNLVDTLKRPVFLWGRTGDGKLRGSARSDGSVHLVELMEATKEGVFEQFGGHEHSGGFTVADDQVHTLAESLHAAFENLTTSDMNDVQQVDAPLDLLDISWKLYDQIKQLAPFGQENPKPVFLFADAPVESVEHFGKEDNHLKVWLQDDNGERVEAIEFFATAEDYPILKQENNVDLLANLEKSTFGGSTTLRLRIVDIV